MFIAQNRFRIAAEHAEAFETQWRTQESRLGIQPGFMRFRLLRASTPEGAAEFVSYTEWLDEASFRGWLEGGAARAAYERTQGASGSSASGPASGPPREAYLGPPEFRGYEVVLDQVPGHRTDFRSVHQDLKVEAGFAKESPEQALIRERSREKGLPPIHIGPFEGRLIEILLRAAGAKRGLEIGTLGGYSSSWIARALPDDGKLLSLEVDADRASFARENLECAGFGAKVEVLEGRALDVLRGLDSRGSWGLLDFVFIDADKAGTPDYVEWAVPRLRKGGLCLIDNAYVWGGMNAWGSVLPPGSEKSVVAMAKAWDQLAFHPEMASIVMPTGEGLAVGLKL